MQLENTPVRSLSGANNRWRRLAFLPIGSKSFCSRAGPGLRDVFWKPAVPNAPLDKNKTITLAFSWKCSRFVLFSGNLDANLVTDKEAWRANQNQNLCLWWKDSLTFHPSLSGFYFATVKSLICSCRRTLRRSWFVDVKSCSNVKFGHELRFKGLCQALVESAVWDHSPVPISQVSLQF